MHTVVRRNDERRVYETELRERERKLRSYFNLSMDPILVVDHQGRLQEANPSACRMLGYTEEELRQRSVRDLIAQDEANLAADRRHFEDVAREGRSRGEVVYLTKGGESLVFDVNAVDLGDGHYLGVLRDMTERRRMEQMQAQHMAELARINAELDEFTYVASHDLQEPLRKLVSFSALLERDLGKELATPVATDLRFIGESARRMKNLVQDLLALSRAGKSVMGRERVSLDEVVDQALENLEVMVQERKAVIERDLLPEVWGDATLLTQLYQNLIGNGMKYVKDAPPRLRLTAERAADGAWMLGVKDNGIGIRSEYAQQIFQPFKRLHAQGEYEGTGIGLAICRKVVERHGGRIWVESEEGRDAHFKFTLGGM
jgi:PAS domain S-box-containing protein